MLSFYTQAVRLMDLLEMVLPKEIVITARCVKPMGYAKKVHSANFLFIFSGLINTNPLIYLVNTEMFLITISTSYCVETCQTCNGSNECASDICSNGYCRGTFQE